MYRILKALFIDRRRARLVRIVGEKGIGKLSLAKALAQRNMWGQILWLPPLQSHGQRTHASPEDAMKMFETVSPEIVENFHEKRRLY